MGRNHLAGEFTPGSRSAGTQGRQIGFDRPADHDLRDRYIRTGIQPS